MVPERFKFMKPLRREMEIAADRARNRLRFVVIKHAGQIAPTFVAADFDQTGADHDPKTEPAKKPDHQDRRAAFLERAGNNQRAEEKFAKIRLEKMGFPNLTLPKTNHVERLHVQRPNERPLY